MFHEKQLRKINKSVGYILAMMVLVSPMLVLQIKGKELFLILQIVFIIAMCFKYKKIVLIKSPLVVGIFIELFISGFLAGLSSMPENYKKTAINLAIMLIPLYFVMCCIKKLLKSGTNVIEIVVRTLKLAVIVELIWIALQLLFYRSAGIDINKMIFVDTLHLVENASFIRSWVWYPSGLSWHSAALAPLFVIGYLFFENMIIRILIVLESFFCGNSTTLLGVCLCALLLFLRNIYFTKKIKKKKIIGIGCIIVIFIAALCLTDIGEKLLQIVANLWIRLFGTEKDASTAAHFGYYSDYIKIIKNSSVLQFIFGYGYGCSGYTITSLYGRYADGGTWAIESDYVDILVSRGIVGFLGYYMFLLYILIKGGKIDSRYFIFMLVILFQGFGYNIQFDYLFFIELFMFLCIKMNINIFDTVDKINCLKKKRG